MIFYRYIGIFLLIVFQIKWGHTQKLIGKITNQNNRPVSECSILLETQDKNQFLTISDKEGFFSFDSIPFGNITLEISKDEYQKMFVVSLFTIKTKDYFLIRLEKEVNVSLDSMVITASPQLADFDGNVKMSRSQYKTMAASFQDPSRILLQFPGFTTDNDGTNTFSFRGLPGFGSSWQIFDTEIVNPNHLITAGNRGDATSVNSGGVNILSSSIISNYSFLTNPSSISISNVMSGVSEIDLVNHFRNYMDFSLIGAETGICKKFGNKYTYATARYSFVGLLEKLGVPFGNESINYQDFSVFSELVKNRRMTLKGFFIYGQSSNQHAAFPLEEPKNTIKDFKNIDYTGQVGMLGIQSSVKVKKNQFLNISMIYSARRDNQIEYIDSLYRSEIPFTAVKRKDQIGLLSGHLHYSFLEKQHEFKTGIKLSHVFQPVKEISFNEEYRNTRVYPYAEYKYQIRNWKWNAGIALHSIFTSEVKHRNTVNYSGSLERSLPKNWYVRINHRFSDHFLANHIVPGRYLYTKTSATEFSIGKSLQKSSWKISAFYYNIQDNNAFIPENGNLISSFNGLDYGADILLFNNPTLNDASVVGGDAIWIKRFTLKSAFLEILGNIAYTKSMFEIENGDKVPARFDIGFSGGFSTYLTLQRNRREWNFGFAFHIREGVREYKNFGQPLMDEWGTLYNTRGGFTETLQPYSRLDLRIVYTKKGARNRQHRISLDIQNVVNQQNQGYTYYDLYLERTNKINQLGLVPVLGYRFEF
ncbi:MAG: carboxypeptidase regulatory-like domain-containing protein [Saprospiraceae bacterium]|nr:carboxypeptidase regulatory-like domain-containing protein [Saprospiraceae bacterium]MBK8548836.1 carboxypeptidase regulatory-like domain-containing protein [Saprospiraceae bacterium]MBK8818945.1 carboxypeptidase regulatory-like domain-containing protein [Saprospiraceae bacterium]MBK8853580.1 carboxypeptidase regulatory-like domain-containing protein [Saprospiraceae bacterium]MBK9041842.1 carboxypeptidase regulatory-like domain-containing protein [Saprospiraceae bacterium]